MESLKNASDLRLKRLEAVIHKAKKDGKIDRSLLIENLRREFGTEFGGEYLMDHTVLAGRHIGIPVLPQRANEIITARARYSHQKQGKTASCPLQSTSQKKQTCL